MEFKPGDLVEIVGNVHEDELPVERIGLLIKKGAYNDTFIVQFMNGYESQYHSMFFAKIEKKQEDDLTCS